MHRDALNQILIIGAGSFGIALASALQGEKNEIHFLSRSSHRFPALKQNLNIPSNNFETFNEFDGNLFKFDLIIFAIPTQDLRGVLKELRHKSKQYVQNSLGSVDIYICPECRCASARSESRGAPRARRARKATSNETYAQNDNCNLRKCKCQQSLGTAKKLFFISTSKGIEQDSIKLPHEIFHDVWRDEMSVAALSGPSFAKELLLKLPTCLTLASTDELLIKKAISIMHTPNLRLYDSADIVGVEIGGALKNVIALLAGISDGLELGHNANAAIITLGLSDIAHIGVSMGASPFTFMGLSGLGDLILTCTSNLSRNKQFGYRLARGETKENIIKEMGEVIEGLATTKSAYQLMKNLNIHSVLLTTSYQILYEDLPLNEALEAIRTHKQGCEFRWLQ